MTPDNRSRDDSPTRREVRQLYVLGEHWRSDIEFYKDELNFLGLLIDKYFRWLVEDENIEATRAIAGRLQSLEEQRKKLESTIVQHLHLLAGLEGNAGAPQAFAFAQDHAMLEMGLSKFVKSFRQLKKEVFALTERIVETEKLQSLLGD